jgi:hypothetical protein
MDIAIINRTFSKMKANEYTTRTAHYVEVEDIYGLNETL